LRITAKIGQAQGADTVVIGRGSALKITKVDGNYAFFGRFEQRGGSRGCGISANRAGVLHNFTNNRETAISRFGRT
jgi:hypothetical protein